MEIKKLFFGIDIKTAGAIIAFFLVVSIIMIGGLFWQRLSLSLDQADLAVSYINCVVSDKEPYEKGLCVKDLAFDAVRDSNISEIVLAMENIEDNAQLQWCHEFMHYVGWGVYDKTDDLFTAFNEANGKCDSGMYHGIVERYIEKTNLEFDAQKFGEAVTNACGDSSKSRKLPQAMKGICQHGLGHGFMLITDNDLNESLRLCDIIKGSEQACYSGAFMENVQSKQVGREGRHPSSFSYNEKVPDFPCNTLDKQYEDYCYVYKGVSNVVLSRGDFKKSFKQCREVKPEFQERCFYGVGSDIPGPFWSAAEAAKQCDFALDVDARAYKQCILGGVPFLMQVNLGNPDAATEYCQVIKPEYKETCYRAAGDSFMDWISDKEGLEEKCAHFSDSGAQEICEGQNK